MPPKNNLGQEEVSDIAENTDNYHVVPSGDEDAETHITTNEDNNDLVSATGDRSEQVQVEEEEELPPQPFHPMIELLFKFIKFLTLPICKLFFAPTTQKTFIKTLVLVVTISWILVTSIMAYIMFYNRYVPPITHVQPAWFNYDGLTGPKAMVDIVAGKSLPLRHEQMYEVSVQLHVPTSDVNFDIGNFMIDLQLQTSNGSIIQSSSRAGILRYQSQTQRIMRVFAKAIPILVGLSEESQMITIKLIDSFRELQTQAVNHVAIAISEPRIQIYDAKLLILANFHGLRYYMYFHYISTALFFIFIFASIEVVFAAITWKGFGEKLWHKLSEALVDNEIHPSVEDDTVSNHSEELSVSDSMSDKSE